MSNGEGVGANFLADVVAVRSRRTRAALAAKAARGERIGTVPYGFRVCSDSVHLEQEPAEQAVIATARMLRAFGLTLRAIIADLESRGMRNRKGRPFTITAVHKMTRASE